MSEQLTIDSVAFASEGRILEGVLPVAGLVRLHDLLTEISGEVQYSLQGLKGERGYSQLRLKASGCIPLACQRCLEAINFSLEVDTLLELVPEGTELSQDELEDDTRDFLPAAGNLDVAELVEDEIILSLPTAPRHEDCGLPGSAEAGEEISPFAVLAKLKGRPN